MCDNSNNSGNLSLSCSASSIESKELEVSEVEGDLETVEPYQFEPPAESDTEAKDVDSGDKERLRSRQRKVVMKKEESASEISCITDHEGFESVCLKVWVLQAAYFSYRYHYGDAEEKDIHEQYHFTAYRQLVGWCWWCLDQRVRVVLPSCAVNEIRTSFPSTSYARFKYPQS